MLKGQHICITGGAGFIGSRLAERLVENNEVTIYDNLSRNSLHTCNVVDSPNLRFIQGDILDIGALKAAVEPANYVIHCAGIAGIYTVVRNTVKTLETNMVGSLNALRAAAETGRCKRIVCFSTSEVMGSLAFVSSETDCTVIGAAGQARWTYAVSKLAEEHLSMAFFKEEKLPAVVVRPFNIYGPGQVGEGAMKIFIKQALKNDPITIYGDGTQIRAWCYIDDMLEGTLRCLESEAAIGESFNIGNNRSVQTIFGLANTVTRVLGSTSPIVYGENKGVDIELRIPCVKKAKNILGFEAKVDLEEGILRTAAFYKNNPKC